VSWGSGQKQVPWGSWGLALMAAGLYLIEDRMKRVMVGG
jgi:hypothetical protein